MHDKNRCLWMYILTNSGATLAVENSFFQTVAGVYIVAGERTTFILSGSVQESVRLSAPGAVRVGARLDPF